nr:glyoxalase superfamily protein [uncultured Devosia sp.]
MSFSLDTPSAQTLKSEAKVLRAQRELAGETLSHGAALEQVARAHGYRDWNTARAALPDRVVSPWQVGQKVKGLYLDQPFTGMLIGVQLLGNMQNYTVTIQFDAPVNVTPTFMFAALRHRVVSTVDIHGTSSAMRGNGNPQLVLKRV